MRRKRRRMRLAVLSAALLAIFATAGGSMIIMPGSSYQGALPPLTSEERELAERLHGEVSVLAERIGERNLFKYRALREAADYVAGRFRDLGLPVREEAYQVEHREVANIVAESQGRSRPGEIVLVGAHYDSVQGSPGANDNGSGVAAMLELARLLKESDHSRTIRFVAFVNEEPPFFQTANMGSVVYARQARRRKEKIVAMLSLETIGYYSDGLHSQRYPPPLSRLYPDTGNFIGFVSDLRSASLLRRAIGTFRRSTRFPSEGVAAPGWIEGMGWSDQWSFWQEGYRGVMLTDTAPFRYPFYHQGADTVEKLDYERMARVVMGIKEVVGDLGKR